MGTPDPVLAEIETFLKNTGMTPTAFGRDALGDPGFVSGLVNGRDCRRSTLQRVQQQIAHYREHGEFIRRKPQAALPAAEQSAA